ncbi:hypothetical protein [Sphingomonas morindae]|uniref:SnoaL-like domain-containing protein n=1 Tax=Sphingomonas morindae TaxID=1541170 RepID=A0ABY4X8G1_9SPHN|nr:hypothetical protein [Sphingomonas morindae]USI72935.1 hypothetical protein LHA26_00165 [Sphingomonas morindae]
MRLIALVSVPAASAMASPPPPPPSYVFSARELLSDAANKDQAKIAAFFANDVSATVNGQPIAQGKSAWLSWWGKDRSNYYGRTLGWSMGWKDNGVLLILDQFDTQDNSTNPPPPGDPRPSTRSTLYHFGTDGLIHSVAISEVNSFYSPAR